MELGLVEDKTSVRSAELRPADIYNRPLGEPDETRIIYRPYGRGQAGELGDTNPQQAQPKPSIRTSGQGEWYACTTSPCMILSGTHMTCRSRTGRRTLPNTTRLRNRIHQRVHYFSKVVDPDRGKYIGRYKSMVQAFGSKTR